MWESSLVQPPFSRWIRATIVDSHTFLEKSKILPKTVKAHEVRAVATSLQLSNKVDMQTVMKPADGPVEAPVCPSS